MTEADFPPVDAEETAIGRLLFYDPILSGNRNISCGTCHHHDHASGDGLALGVGEGGKGVGEERSTGAGAHRIEQRVPRNAPALFNLGARQVTTLFHDGRLTIAETYANGFDSPAEEALPDGLASILAAQALFPITSETEMAGSPGENDISFAAGSDITRAWAEIAKRVRTIPAYGTRLAAVNGFDDAAEVTIVEIANALGAFVASEWRSFDSPYDRFLAGEASLPADAMRGLDLFFGAAGCGTCHSGPLLTDQRFHALALPHFGPGRTRPFDPYVRDVGRMAETDRLEDAYRFRTPSLRNVALTAPYGHNGAYATLEGIVRHHLDPVAAFDAWTETEVALPAADWLAIEDFVALEDRRERARLRAAVDIAPVALTDGEVADLVAFLNALTGAESVKGRLGRPETVPSGLPVD
ncbi:MAG: cytochrome c peroxidase [Pseudomonadota bacterium]